MDAPELPEDLNRWPKDPYKLLGVSPGVHPKELRRVYTRLIRAYKPEQQPDQFRRIREAYELIMRQVEFWHSVHGPSGEPEPEPNATDANQVADQQTPTAWQSTATDEDVDRLWQQACAGQEAEAYRGLEELIETQPQRTDLRIRLYWLLTLNPDLDEVRYPGDWLVPGLLQHGLGGPLWELYRREIYDDPEEATTDRFQKLLELPLSTAGLTDVLECAWQAVSRLGRADLIQQDLEEIAPRYRVDDDNYLRLLILAVEQLASIDDPRARHVTGWIGEQLKRFEHSQIRLAAELDRLEFLIKFVQDLNDLRLWQTPPSDKLLRLTALSLSRPIIEIRQLAWQVLHELAMNPAEGLSQLDRMRRSAPTVLSQLEIALLLFQGTLPPPPEESRYAEELDELIQRFLDQVESWLVPDYQAFRSRYLTFCIQEAIPPELLAQAANDWPLRIVWHACRLLEH